MTSSSTSSEGRDRPKYVFASADVTLNLSEGASVVSDLLSVDEQAAEFGAGGCFFLRTRSCEIYCTTALTLQPSFRIRIVFSVQGRCVLFQQSVGLTSTYTQVLGARLDHWRPSCVSLVETRRGDQTATGEWHGVIIES